MVTGFHNIIMIMNIGFINVSAQERFLEESDNRTLRAAMLHVGHNKPNTTPARFNTHIILSLVTCLKIYME